MRAAGLTPEEIEAQLGAAPAAEKIEIEVWPENCVVWDVWLYLSNQWRMVSGMGGVGYLGLEFASIPVALEMAGVDSEARREVMQALRQMEGEALEVLNVEEKE